MVELDADYLILGLFLGESLSDAFTRHRLVPSGFTLE